MTDIHIYIKNLCHLAPEIHIVPLEFNEFNNCKSNIAWIEATLAGAKVIASPANEFKDMGMMGNMRNLTEGDHKLSWEFIMDNLLLTSLNKLRLENVRKLL